MADLASTHERTPSMIDEVDDDMAPLGHVSNFLKVGHDEDGIPIGSPNGIDAVAKSTMEDPGRREIKSYTCSKNPDESSAEIPGPAHVALSEGEGRNGQRRQLEGRNGR